MEEDIEYLLPVRFGEILCSGHTQDGSMICGGPYTSRSCRRWNNETGTWDLVTESLTGDRLFHVSWTPEDSSVTYLMGSSWTSSGRTSEVIDQDIQSAVATFSLKYDTT